MLPVEISVLTLNVWGIPFISSDRQTRIAAIGAELSSGQYDIVSMQEVWSQKDYQTLKELTETTLPYSYYFYSGVIGAGLVVLSKFPIVGTLFHAWSVNGYFHRIQHADWFGGKGVGMCKIIIGDNVVHLYNAHLHAEYDNENDEYKTHRVIQAFDTAQFIEATRSDSILQILAGDLNTQPQDITYKLLLYASKMSDCCSSDTIKTNECKYNSYTSSRASSKNPEGIRIDHIFVRAATHVSATISEYKLPFPHRVPGQKFSYSDHEAVLAKLKLSVKRVLESTGNEACPADDSVETSNASIGDANVILSSQNTNHQSVLNENTNNCDSNNIVVMHDESTVSNRMTALKESIKLCDTSIEQLRVDRILYYSVAGFLAVFLFLMVEYTVPRGFKTVYLLLKFIIFTVMLFCVFMGSIWNYMERNGILSGKTSMEIMLRYIEKYEID